MIKSVKGLSIGHIFVYNGALYKVTGFPTRRSVNGELIHNTKPLRGMSLKVSLSLSQIYFDEMFNQILLHERNM